ncbi:MAG: putative protein kinase UbiB [Chlamydiae bacterium]|nr:putative protein kinase UbiB [Chlamydiota bacterium]
MSMFKPVIILIKKLPRFLFLKLFKKDKIPKFVTQLIYELGPVYVKCAQVMSTRKDLFSEEFLEELGHLRDKVPSEDEETMRSFLKSVAPKKINEIFAEFNFELVAAGSVAQVYKGKLTNGEIVAIKVLRPGIREKIEDNFKLIRFLVKIIEKINSSIRAINLKEIVSEIEELLLSQTNLENEAANYEEFKKVFEHDQNLQVPKVYREYSNRQFMVSEFINGIQPYDYNELDIDPRELASRVDNLLDTMIFMRGFCHADLHPGNFFWSREGEIILIDFGLVHRLPQIDRDDVMTFYLSIFDGFYDFAADYFLKTFLNTEECPIDLSIDDNVVYKSIYKLIHEQFTKTNGEGFFSSLFRQLLKVMRKYHLKIEANYSKLFLTLITIEGYIFTLDPSFDMIENTRKKRLDSAEYASISHEAEQLIFGEFGTYSTAMFVEGVHSTEAAYRARDDYILDQLKMGRGNFVIDVGCGRGRLLEKFEKAGMNALGITISKNEHEVCKKEGLDTIWSSWEDSDKSKLQEYPLADGMTVIEMLTHLGSLHENKVGLLEKRLERFFSWADRKLKEDGRLFIQCLNVDRDFLCDEKYVEDYNRIQNQLPWLGFTTLEQVISSSNRYFKINECENHSHDLLKTYYSMKRNVDRNFVELEKLIKPEIFSFLLKEADALIELSERDIISLHRIVLQKK